MNTSKAKPRAVIGEIEGILFVVFVQQVGDFGEETRIISARAANKNEAKTYLMMKYADYLK
ncbi:MAG: BrnT family toxin [Oribacterium sp.]|nr:BrnT family toxin [Oribacterium sp.]